MPCSPAYIQMDILTWSHPQVAPMLLASYENLSQGDNYDCALTTVSCESKLLESIGFSIDHNKIFWCDLICIYILFVLFFFVGMFGNIANIAILSRNKITSDSTSNLLLMLSVSDLGFVSNVGILALNGYVCLFDTATAINMYSNVAHNLYFLTKWLGILSLDCVTLMSIQRCVAVVFPFKMATIFSNRNTNIIIAVLVMMYLGTSIPLHLSMRSKLIFHPYFGKYIYLGYEYIIDVDIILGVFEIIFLCRSALDLMILITSTTLTVYKVKLHVKDRAKMLGSRVMASDNIDTNDRSKTAISKREVKVVKLSIAVCYISFVIYSVECVSSFTMMFIPGKMLNALQTILLMYMSKMCGALGGSFNFFLYMVMSQQYREAFRKMFKL